MNIRTGATDTAPDVSVKMAADDGNPVWARGGKVDGGERTHGINTAGLSSLLAQTHTCTHNGTRTRTLNAPTVIKVISVLRPANLYGYLKAIHTSKLTHHYKIKRYGF